MAKKVAKEVKKDSKKRNTKGRKILQYTVKKIRSEEELKKAYRKYKTKIYPVDLCEKEIKRGGTVYFIFEREKLKYLILPKVQKERPYLTIFQVSGDIPTNDIEKFRMVYPIIKELGLESDFQTMKCKNSLLSLREVEEIIKTSDDWRDIWYICDRQPLTDMNIRYIIDNLHRWGDNKDQILEALVTRQRLDPDLVSKVINIVREEIDNGNIYSTISSILYELIKTYRLPREFIENIITYVKEEKMSPRILEDIEQYQILNEEQKQQINQIKREKYTFTSFFQCYDIFPPCIDSTNIENRIAEKVIEKIIEKISK